MESIIFTISSEKVLTIGDLLQNELFECISVTAKDTAVKAIGDSKISDFRTVLFGVKRQSSFGFELAQVKDEYRVIVPPLATPSDWTGALMFIKMLLLILDASECRLGEEDYSIDSITDFESNEILLRNIDELATEVHHNPIVVVQGVRRPIYFNELFLGQLVHGHGGDFFDGYDKRLRLTQQINAYFSEQQVFRIEQSENDGLIVVNYLNSEVPTALPAQAELTSSNRNTYPNQPILDYRLFIMTAKGEKLAEVSYNNFLCSLTEGIFMLDAKYMVVDPISKEKLDNITVKFR